jgi:hypothetical protein
MKQYEPKKKKYNDLLSLHDEMLREKVKSLEFNGVSIKTKTHIYTLLDGQISIRKK